MLRIRVLSSIIDKICLFLSFIIDKMMLNLSFIEDRRIWRRILLMLCLLNIGVLRIYPIYNRTILFRIRNKIVIITHSVTYKK